MHPGVTIFSPSSRQVFRGHAMDRFQLTEGYFDQFLPGPSLLTVIQGAIGQRTERD